jgi:hypothetical protein
MLFRLPGMIRTPQRHMSADDMGYIMRAFAKKRWKKVTKFAEGIEWCRERVYNERSYEFESVFCRKGKQFYGRDVLR